MSIKAVFVRALLALGTALVGCTLFAGDAAAADPPVTVNYQVTTRGLDVRQPAGAHELYARVKHAARIVCTHGMRVDLKDEGNESACYEKAIVDAIRSVHLPLLTQAYLETHTLQQAMAAGIDVPVMIAAK